MALVKVKYDGVYLLLYKESKGVGFETFRKEKEMNQRILELTGAGFAQEIITVSETGCWRVKEVKS